MRARTIIELSDYVLGPGFSVDGAIEMFGPRDPRPRANGVRLTPRDELLGVVEVELSGAGDPVGLRVQFAELLPIDLGPLRDAFGEPELQARLKPHQPRPWRFTRADGWVTLMTTSGEPRATHDVAKVIIRRRPPAKRSA